MHGKLRSRHPREIGKRNKRHNVRGGSLWGAIGPVLNLAKQVGTQVLGHSILWGTLVGAPVAIAHKVKKDKQEKERKEREYEEKIKTLEEKVNHNK